MISADPVPTPSGRGIYACRLSGCQASLTSALPPRSHPAGVPVSPGCHVSTASRCPPASYGGQHSPPVFWPVNMAGTSCHGISLRRQISLAPGSGFPPAAGRSLPTVRIWKEVLYGVARSRAGGRGTVKRGINYSQPERQSRLSHLAPN